MVLFIIHHLDYFLILLYVLDQTNVIYFYIAILVRE